MRAALALAFLVAGGAADFADASLVQGLRLLGVQAEPPEAQPGDTVTMRAWVVDTERRGITVSWSACTLPSNGLANPGCVTGSDGLIPLGTGATHDIVVPDVPRATLGPKDATDGVYLPIVVHLTVAGDSLDGIYRLRMLGDQPA